jgi:hypothetical protein
MQRSVRMFLLLLLPCLLVVSLAAQPKPADATVAVSVETTLSTASAQIRQFAFDRDPDSYFLSAQNAGATDHFTLVFDKPVTVKSITATTGRPQGGETLDPGVLEISTDGKQFKELAKFAEGVARGLPQGVPVQAVRLRPAEDLKHPLAIREIAIESDPPLAVFKYPVEFAIDVTDAPEMKEWTEKAARICARQYPMICAELKSDGFKPPHLITLTMKTSYNGVAATSGDRITGSVKYFKAHPDDVGAMVHETVHVVQRYRLGNNPGWLVEGIADYIRFYKYEPNKPKALRPEQAKYNGSYRVTAAFLDYLTQKHDKDIVGKLNKAMREGEYKEEVFKVLTKKSLAELDEEWRASLGR